MNPVEHMKILKSFNERSALEEDKKSYWPFEIIFPRYFPLD